MYVDSSTVRSKTGKTYTRHLLRESFRENGKVKHRTIANVSHCSEAEIEALRLALRAKGHLADLSDLQRDVTLSQGMSVGAVGAADQVARRLGIAKALGSSREGKLALWQVIARVIDQGSRLSAVRLAGSHAACEVLGLQSFDEDDLYENLDWLDAHQQDIEKQLFQDRSDADPSDPFFLYDVTSSYLEGQCNELAAFGYNRDGKTGKMQIVVGLLTDASGRAVSVQVFEGNTQDPKTFADQVHKVTERFGGGPVAFVGDRGMIKARQIEQLHENGFHYITAITKPQIESLMNHQQIQLEFFSHELVEVTEDDGVRYILRRNPVRAEEMARAREDKQRSVQKLVDAQNEYLAEHPRAQTATAMKKVQAKLDRLRIAHWLRCALDGRTLRLQLDQASLAEASKLDGCYVLKTDLSSESASREVVHERYKSLAEVEQAFRTSKTVHLEMRPIHVRLASRTRGHVLVVMLAQMIAAELARCWQPLNMTVQEGLDRLAQLCTTTVSLKGEPRLHRVPQPREDVQKLLETADVELPKALAHEPTRVHTRRKLPGRRKKR